ncbi:hypothetical protein IW261DRAFT_1628788 [Armillaria novae-zelandiae]|uniref:Uncharacterized protein n=1 Tax=Armillaria novae-zelandiae TaxID=153914 RepID=A0AA39NAT6_9AGAR|nr:hypothetical protein IW261DRAFT_1628788 [Armillaria novae-zelandiae]
MFDLSDSGMRLRCIDPPWDAREAAFSFTNNPQEYQAFTLMRLGVPERPCGTTWCKNSQQYTTPPSIPQTPTPSYRHSTTPSTISPPQSCATPPPSSHPRLSRSNLPASPYPSTNTTPSSSSLAIPPWRTFDDLEGVLGLAETWRAKGAMDVMRGALTALVFLREPLRVYAIATWFGWDEEAELASKHTLELSLHEEQHHEAPGRSRHVHW